MAQINKPEDYFNTVLYTGDGTSSHAITGVGFQPDWVWIKRRNDVDSHFVYDSVRFDGSNAYWLQTNNNNAEGSDRPLTAFGSDGFTIGSNNSGLNANSSTYVSWNWLGANGTASNTDGSITSTVSANTTSGFSIVSYVGNQTSGATVGHGLGVKPSMVIIKNRDTAHSWRSYHSSLGATKYITLDSTASASTNTNFMNDTEPTSSVFSLGNGLTPNQNGDDYIAYCFAEKKGFSKFGSYTGNGNADGPFIYTGFKPAFVMIKQTTSATDWFIVDNKRSEYNVINKLLYPNGNFAEGTSDTLDFTSQGFKLRSSNNTFNQSGNTFIYMAFAENPLVGTNNIPTTAR